MPKTDNATNIIFCAIATKYVVETIEIAIPTAIKIFVNTKITSKKAEENSPATFFFYDFFFTSGFLSESIAVFFSETFPDFCSSFTTTPSVTGSTSLK